MGRFMVIPKRLRGTGVGMGRFFALVLGLMALAVPAAAQSVLKFGTSPSPIPYITGPVDPGTQQANLNSLIQELNTVLSPVLPVSSASLTTGTSVVVGPPSTTTGTVGVLINPTSAGAIQLFTQADTGLLQIGAQAAWFPAKALTVCPGTSGGLSTSNLQATSTNQLLGPGGTVSGYFSMTDWMGRPHYMVTC